MAFRLCESVAKIEIDNRLQGHVLGHVWVAGQADPIRLDLTGDCMRDIAGHRIVVRNRDPVAEEDPELLCTEQHGVVGDITASRRFRMFDVPWEDALRLRREGKEVSECLANGLYLEWFSEENGRVVIELADLEILELSQADWTMSGPMERQQSAQNRQAFREYLEDVELSVEQAREEWDEDDYEPMDEFEWEQTLRESDAVTERFSEVFDRYVDHPDGEKLIAREMGWDWLDDALDADERGLFESNREDEFPADPINPNPLTEGHDWIRTGGGGVKHPLSHRAYELAMSLWRRCKDAGLLGEHGDDDLRDMLFQAQTLGAKLAGTLDSLAYDIEPEGGFIVACLKRALQYFDAALGASRRVEEKGLLAPDELRQFRRELFAIRESMLVLMKRFRRS